MSSLKLGAFMAMFTFSTGSLLAQETTVASDTTQKLVIDQRQLKKTIVKADKHFKMREMTVAVGYYNQVLQMQKDNYHAARSMARAYWYMDKLDSSRYFYEYAIQLEPNKNDTIYYDLAMVLKKMGKYQETKKILGDFMKRYKNDDVLRRHAQVEIEGCDFALKEMSKKEMNYRTVCVGEVNKEGSEYSPAMWSLQHTATGSPGYLIFTAHRPENLGKVNEKYLYSGEKFSDLWMAKIINDSTFEAPIPIISKKKINTKVFFHQAGFGLLKAKYGISRLTRYNPGYMRS